MEHNWTKVGESAGIDRDKLASAISSVEWQAIPCEMGMGQGMGIKAAIKQLRVPKVTHVGESRQLSPFGLYGIRGHYANGMAEVYILDRGSDLVPVRSDFEPTNA